MKKIFSIILTVAILCLGAIGLTSCGEDSIIVQTNAFFAPFEYYDGTEIVGVDVEIMELVGKKLGKKLSGRTETSVLLLIPLRKVSLLIAAPQVLRLLRSALQRLISQIPITHQFST
ncbi:MAG: transporter substrate-binding domain-containing protein [Oscillospiraceae bacterium]|nr:transporter substrate-binding domain-containing protein [Oscillospiraceae bacterium]